MFDYCKKLATNILLDSNLVTDLAIAAVTT